MIEMPLAGVTVADFSRVLAGPLAGSALADLGADVIKVERPGVGDDTRWWGPPWAAESSTYFESVNRSKRSVELDLSDPEDLGLARELARRSDVVIENFRDDGLARYGLDYPSVQARNPGLVYCSITGFGSRGGARLSGYDFLVQAVGGLMSITGDAQGEPTKVGVALVDVLTSKDAVVGILAALRSRELTGLGQRVEVNLLSSLLGSMVNQASAYLTTGQVPRRMGNQHPSIAPYETLRCQDGWIAVCCGNDVQFARLVEELRVPSLAADPRFRVNADRVQHRDELVVLLASALEADGVEGWINRLTRVGVPVGKVGDLADAFDLAGSLGLDPIAVLDSGHATQVRNPVTYSATPVSNYMPPPRLGQHNEEIRQWLAEPSKEEHEA